MNEQELIEWVKRWKLGIGSLIGAITAAVGFALLFRQNTQLVTLVVIVSLLVLVWCGSVYVALAKTRSPIFDIQTFKFPRARAVAIMVMIIIPLGAIGTAFWAPTRSFTSIAVYGTPTHTLTPTPTSTLVPIPTLTAPPTGTPILFTPSLSQVRVGSDEYDYKVEITALNPTDDDLLITHLQFVSEIYEPRSQCLEPGPPRELAISDHITVQRYTDGILTFGATVIEHPNKLEGLTFPAHGSIFRSCRIDWIVLGLDTSFALPRNSYSTFFISIPKRLQASNENLGTIGVPIPEDFQPQIVNHFISVYPRYDPDVRWQLLEEELIRSQVIIEVKTEAIEFISIVLQETR